MAVQRPQKTSGSRTFVAERDNGYPLIEAAEVDADLDTIYNAVNTGLVVLPPLADLSVATNMLANGAVTSPKIADGAVIGTKIPANTITGAHIQGASITDTHIVSLSWAKLLGVPATFPPGGGATGDLTGSYPAPVIAGGAVTRAKTAADCWLSPIPTGGDVGKWLTVGAGPALAWAALPAQPIADLSVTEPKFAAGAVSTRALADASVTAAKIQPGVIPSQLPPVNGSVTALSMAVDSVGNAALQDEAVTLDNIDQDSVPLPPWPIHANLGMILGVIEAGTPNKPTIAWVNPATYLPGGGGGGGGGLWAEDLDANMLEPLDFFNRGILLASGRAITWADPGGSTMGRRTGIEADDNSLRLWTGSQAMLIFNHDQTQSFLKLVAATGNIDIGPNSAAANPSEKLEIEGGIRLSVALAAQDGTLQYTGTKFQGRVGGAWVDIPGAGGGGGGWTDTGSLLQPTNSATYPISSGPATHADAVLPTVTISRTTAAPNFTDFAMVQFGDAIYSRLAAITATAAETHSGSSGGTDLRFLTASLGQNFSGERLRINANGSIWWQTANKGMVLSTGSIAPGTLGRELLDVLGAVVIGASTAATPVDGTLQYASGKFQGRAGGAWVDIPGAANWTDTGSVLQPAKGATYPVTCGDILTTNLNASGAGDGSTVPSLITISHSAIPSQGALCFLGRSRPSLGVVQSGDIIGSYSFNGFWGSGQYGIGVSMQAVAAETFSTTTAGSLFLINVTPLGSNATQERLRIDTGGVTTLANSTVVIPGISGNALRWGSRTIKGRLIQPQTWDAVYVSYNKSFDTSDAWVIDDNAKPAWQLGMRGDTDMLLVERKAPGGAIASLLTLDNAGRVSVNGAVNQWNTMCAGGTTCQMASSIDATGDAVWSTNSPFAPQDATKGGWMLKLTGPSGAATSAAVQFFYRGPNGAPANNLVSYLDGSGNLILTGPTGQKASGTTWSNPSDPRLKQDMGPYDKGLAAICQLEPITYHLKSTPDGPLCYGFDASAVKEIFPECVGTTMLKLDPEDETATEVLTFDMHPILVAMINAIKELAARN